MQKTDKSLKR